MKTKTILKATMEAIIMLGVMILSLAPALL